MTESKLILPRRDFLAGLAAAFAAPAIVRPASLMPVKVFHPAYYDRFIVDYLIGSDELALRMDRATIPLPTPRTAYEMLTADQARTLVPHHVWERFTKLRPAENEQYNLDYRREHYSSDHQLYMRLATKQIVE